MIYFPLSFINDASNLILRKISIVIQTMQATSIKISAPLGKMLNHKDSVCVDCAAVFAHRNIILHGQLYSKCFSCASTREPVNVLNWCKDCLSCNTPFAKVLKWMACVKCGYIKCVDCARLNEACLCERKKETCIITKRQFIKHARHLAFMQLLINITPVIFEEYCKWLIIKYRYPGAEPPTVLSIIWKTHILHTIQYRDLCVDIVGSFVENNTELITNSEITRRAYNVMFGSEYPPDYSGICTIHIGIWSTLAGANGYIHIKDSVKHLCVLPIRDTMTIGEVKQWYGDIYSISTVKGKILFAGAILGEVGKIRDYQIMPSDILEYVVDDASRLYNGPL